MMDITYLIAQATAQDSGASDAGAAGAPGDSFMRLFLPMILAIGAFYFFLFRGQKKERKKVQDMLNNLKRNDRVQTIGGILGTVVDVRDNEVVLKVDETNNVKMRFNRGAIKEVLGVEVESK